MFAKVLGLVLLSLLVAAVVTRTSVGSGREQVYVVQPADTLWSIAVAHFAGDPREGVWKLERRNHLAGEVIQPGEHLVLP